MTAADIFDGFTSQWDYKREWKAATALEHLHGLASAGKVDPECVAALAASQEAIDQIMQRSGR